MFSKIGFLRCVYSISFFVFSFQQIWSKIQTMVWESRDHFLVLMLSQFSCNGSKFKLFSIVFNVQPLKVYLLLDFNFEQKFYYLEKHKNAHGKFIFHFGYLYFVSFIRVFFSARRLPFMLEAHTITYYCILVHRQSKPYIFLLHSTFCSIFGDRPYFALHFCSSSSL